MHIAQAANCTSEIVAIGAGSDAVPSVTGNCQAPGFGTGKVSAAAHCFPSGILGSLVLASAAIAMLSAL